MQQVQYKVYAFRVCLVATSCFLLSSIFAQEQKVIIKNKSDEDLCLYYIKGNAHISPTPCYIDKGSQTELITLDNSHHDLNTHVNAVIRIVGCYGHGPWLSLIFAASLNDNVQLKNCYYPNKCDLIKSKDGTYHVTIS